MVDFTLGEVEPSVEGEEGEGVEGGGGVKGGGAKRHDCPAAGSVRDPNTRATSAVAADLLVRPILPPPRPGTSVSADVELMDPPVGMVAEVMLPVVSEVGFSSVVSMAVEEEEE